MTREQTIRLAKAVKAIGAANQLALDLAMEVLLTEPKVSLAISTQCFDIGEANSKILDVVKEHSKKYLQNG